MTIDIRVGDCLELLPTMEAESFDAVVTDPPYHLTTGKKGGSGDASVNLNSPAGRSRVGTGFMGKKWDGGDVAFRPETWAAVLRVARPGAYLVAFGGTRTFHRLTCAIEDAGFEIHDAISWLYGSGFPKHVSKLKPGWEPIILARRPAARATPLNIDACRIEGGVRPLIEGPPKNGADAGQFRTQSGFHVGDTTLGRWPANVVLDEEAAQMLDAQSGTLKSGANPTRRGSNKFANTYGDFVGQESCEPARGVDVGGASRFYYCAKASRADRNAGLDGHTEKPLLWSAGTQSPNTHRAAQNHHPTVKPLDLMQWLCRLVTPKGGTVLDPFCGSGSTGRAAIGEGFSFVGIELDPEYAAIAHARIADYAPLFNEPAA